MTAARGAQSDVIVVGGGVAGIASALAHLDHGFSVTLVESRPCLGGRAWARPKNGVCLDNGTHVLLGGYDAFRRLLRMLGSEELFWHPPALELAWLREGGELLQLRPPRWPAPLHLVGAFLGLGGLELDERFSLLASGLAPFLPLPREGETLAEWFARKSHGRAARDLLFVPLCRAIMNEEPERVSARAFLSTLRQAFTGSAARSSIWVPSEPWSRILDEPARRLLEQRGARVLLGERVTAIDWNTLEDSAPGLVLGDGQRLTAAQRIVLALPWHELARLDQEQRIASSLDRIESAPIVNLHVELPHDSLDGDDPVIGLLVPGPFHFVCRRPDARGRARRDVPACMIAGAARPLDGLSAGRIRDLGLAQLARALGRAEAWPETMRERAVVIRESRATIVCRPHGEQLRPRPGQTAVPGVWLAGEWTDVGLPSTLEGAALSAFLPFENDGRIA